MAVIEARRVAKRFGAVTALSDVGVALEAGRVTAIVGENGAGKSTLAKILAGVYRADAGELFVDGRPVTFRSRKQAAALGIAFVPQSLSFVGTLSALDNHMLARSGLFLNRRAARADLETTAARVGFAAEWDTPAERLSLAQRQLAEIVSALAHGARALLLDEPTSALGPVEIERLIAALGALSSTGVAIGLVTHRVREVLESAQDVTVLRQGEMVFAGPVASLNGDAIARLMVGERARVGSFARRTLGGARLSVNALTVERALRDVSFEVRRGEILGVAGVAGAAQPALAAAVSGLLSPARGGVAIDGVDVTGRPAEARRRGLAYIPERRTEGVPPQLPVSVAASLLRLGERAFTRAGVRRRGAELALATGIVERFDVNPKRPWLRCGALSGGNQQKLLVGREIERQPQAIVAHGPTQGLDLAAAYAIRASLVDAAAAGAAVLVISTDLDELLAISDRILVLAGGAIAGEFDVAQAGDDAEGLAHRIGLAMTGAEPREAA